MNRTASGVPHIAVCIATYKRPDLLAGLLESLRGQDSNCRLSLVIVDNDPAGSGRPAVDGTELDVVYAIEPKPGIAAARNRSLDLVPEEADAVVFVDDDETATFGWLAELVSCWEVTGADVVTGPVTSLLPPDTPGWIIRGSFIQRPNFESGPYSFLPATNNTLVSAQLLRGTRFSEAFSLTGGSDTELFFRLREDGAIFVWCAEAVVEEIVPRERTTWRWIWRRGMRSGNVLARIQLKSRPRWKVALVGLARLAYGSARVILNALILRFRYDDVIYVLRGIGFLGAISGRLYVEYQRTNQKEMSDRGAH